MPLIHAEQRSDEWLRARMGKITASIAAACLGLDPYKGPITAWKEIIGTANKQDNHFIRHGTANEGTARNAYEVTSGLLVCETGFWVHPSLEWLGASPDGLVGADGLVEIKCPQVLPNEVPIQHRIQGLVQLAVTGREWFDYYAWTREGDFCERINLQESFRAGDDTMNIDDVISGLAKFYAAHVVTGIAPEKRKPKKREKK